MDDAGDDLGVLELEEAAELQDLVARVLDSKGDAAAAALPRWKQIVSAAVADDLLHCCTWAAWAALARCFDLLLLQTLTRAFQHMPCAVARGQCARLARRLCPSAGSNTHVAAPTIARRERAP